MASYQLELQTPPRDESSCELWLQHAAGRIIFEDIRGYALERIDRNLSSEAQEAARKATDDAVYGLMMIIDGVSGTLRNDKHEVEISVAVSLLDRTSGKLASQIDLREGNGMCIGYHGWLEGAYGDNPVAVEGVHPARARDA